MTRIVPLMMQCIKSVICEEKLDKEMFTSVTKAEWEKLFLLSQKHDVSHLLSYAVFQNKIEIPDEELAKRIKKRHSIALLRYETANQVYCSVCEMFEKAGIAFIPLKGLVIRDYYPQVWMRTSCDIDILIHEEDLTRASDILENSLGYTKELQGSHDVSFFATNRTHIELHFSLSEVFYESKAEKLLNEVWKYTDKNKECNSQCFLKDEFFYLYHIYHMAKHFEHGGCGVKPFIDLWILDNMLRYDRVKREELLKKTQLFKFSVECKRLSNVWFSDGESDETISKMQMFVLSGGTYGSANNKKMLNQKKYGIRAKRIACRIFMSYDKLKIQYPVIKNHKWLTPLCEVHRWFKMIDPKYRKKAKEYFKSEIFKKADTSNETLAFLKQIGLK